MIQGIKINAYNIAYMDIPKVACTSIKQALYELETGKKFDRREIGISVHKYFSEKQENILYTKYRFLIVRDPVKRFLSGYSNRVTYHKELSREYLEKIKNPNASRLIQKDIPLDPGLGQFFDYFDDYMTIPNINHHLKPCIHFLNTSLSTFNYIYKLEEISKFEQHISSIINKEFKLPRTQTGGRKFSVKDLSSKQLDFLIDFYKKDYELLKEFYTIDDIWKEWKR